MSSLRNETRDALLRSLHLDTGQAEEANPRSIFPVPEHIRALEPEVALIVGDRGAGKTHLKRALVDDDVRGALLKVAPGVKGPTRKAAWLDGWPLKTLGPAPAGWVAAQGRPEDARDLWMALLLRSAVQAKHLPPEGFSPIVDPPGADANAVLAGYRGLAVQVAVALDSLENRLADTDAWLFVAYDELDTLASDWNVLRFAISGLVSFWATYARRWWRLRPKIFLRSDFFKHHREVAGADVAKLGANRVDLVWSDKNLYGALVKHIMNKVEPGTNDPAQIADFLDKAIKCDTDSVLGRIPRLRTAEDAKPFVERLVDRYMGANSNKGLAFRWLLDHLRDGNKHALPRSLMRLIEHAAQEELAQPKAKGAHLLDHRSVRRALDKVSEEHVSQAQTHELQWLEGLATRLSTSREVPWSRRDLLNLLKRDFAGSWSKDQLIRPPGNDAEELLQSLFELGVVRARPKDEVDVPDLYLHGLGLKRRGGVARR